MSAEILRRAAAKMRERAEAATEGPWRVETPNPTVTLRSDVRAPAETTTWDARGDAVATMGDSENGACGLPDATHIASWHPAVALAVADWLDAAAAAFEDVGAPTPEHQSAFACYRLARAYLGEGGDE